MLEQAIIDATALREAAIKNAETSIIEKYSTEIKGMVDTLLEQEAVGDEFADQASPEGSEKKIIDEMPLAATEGNDMCPCPDEEQLVKIDIPEIMKQLEEEEAEGFEPDMGDLADRSEIASDLDQEELQEELVIDEDALMSILEDLEIDIEPVKSGWLETPTSYIQRAEEEAEALEAHLDEEEEDEDDSPLGGLDLKEVEEKTIELRN